MYTPEQVKQVVELFLGGAERDQLDPILDACVAVYVNQLDEDAQVEFKGKAKLFCRTYSFLSSLIPYRNARENTPHTARMAHDQALSKVMQHLLKDDTQVYRQFVENESFKRFLGDMVYALTNEDLGSNPSRPASAISGSERGLR